MQRVTDELMGALIGMGDMTSDINGTPIAEITGTPPFAIPTQKAAATATAQKTKPSMSARVPICVMLRCRTLAPVAAKD